MSKQAKISLAIGAAVLAATIVVFVIIRPEMFPSTVLGLGFLLYSEIVLFGGFALIDSFSGKTSKLLWWSGAGTLTGVYGLVVFASSLIYLLRRTVFVQGFLILQVILLVVAAALCLIVGGFSVSIKRKDAQTLQAGAVIQYVMDQLALVKEQTGRGAELDRLIEAVRFSDPSVSVDADVEIYDAIARLQELAGASEPEGGEFEKAVQNMEFLIKKRNLQAKASKQGGI